MAGVAPNWLIPSTDEYPTLTTKGAELPFYTSDNKEKIRTFWELSCQELSMCDTINRSKFMSLVPTEVSKIIEPQQKYLCIQYGPAKRPFFIYLDFSDSREDLEEWERLLQGIIGKIPPHRPRSKSATFRKAKSSVRTLDKVKSAIQLKEYMLIPEGDENDTITVGGDEANSDEDVPPEPAADEAVAAALGGVPPESPAPIPTFEEGERGARDAPGTSHEDGERDETGAIGTPHDEEEGGVHREASESDYSRPSSLRSQDGGSESYKREFRLSTLQRERDQPEVDVELGKDSVLKMKLTLADHRGHVYVSDIGESCTCNLNIGDSVLAIASQRVSDAKDAMERIDATSSGTKVQFRLQRFPMGNLCVMPNGATSWPDIGIVVDGSKIIEMQPERLFRRSCDPCKVIFEGRQWNRAISSFNGQPVSYNSTSHEVQDLICEACGQDGPMVFQVHPVKFLQALASNGSTNL